MNNDEEELKRLDFENFLWIVFIFLAALNIIGDLSDQEYIKTKDAYYQSMANKIFEFTLIISFIIYIYYFIRNYAFYEKATGKEKEKLFIKLLGSVFILIGAICFIYFQFVDESFEGTPAI